MNQPLVALCVGHSRKIGGKLDGGAVSVGKVNEWTYNRDLALKIHQVLASLGIASFVEDDYRGSSYIDSMKWLASHLKARGATLAVELHFNAANGTARGHEWLFWKTSKKSERLATLLESKFDDLGTGIPSRGIKARTSTDRGGQFLRLTHCPAVICEPFFGDNAEDWHAATDRKGDISKAYAAAIADFLE